MSILLQESGDWLLLENGDAILLEQTPVATRAPAATAFIAARHMAAALTPRGAGALLRARGKSAEVRRA